MDYYDQVKEAADAVRARIPAIPSIGIVLGSGLGTFLDRLEGQVSMPYRSLPHWPLPGVPGHEGRLAVGTVRGRPVIALAGRCHLYEGHSPQTVVFGVRALGLLGVRLLILTNAAGGIRLEFPVGALMIVDDHINLTGANPLAGPNDDRFGTRFPDLSQPYSARLRAMADVAGRSTGVPLVHGTYAAVAGPSYETPAEIRYLRTIGADAVGMSTVPETIAARHMGLEVLGISCISNMAAGLLPRPLDHAEVVETTRRAGAAFASLLEEIVGQL